MQLLFELHAQAKFTFSSASCREQGELEYAYSIEFVVEEDESF